MELALHPNEILLLYDGKSAIGKKTLAYAQAASSHINEMDYSKMSLSTTIWKEILNMLHIDDPKMLFDKSHPEY